MAHGEQLARIAHKYPDRVSLVCGEQTRTMAELDQRVNRLAGALAQRGLGPGDRLAVLMGNSIEMVEAIFAGWRLGAIVVPVNFRLVADEVGFILADSGPGSSSWTSIWPGWSVPAGTSFPDSREWWCWVGRCPKPDRTPKPSPT